MDITAALDAITASPSVIEGEERKKELAAYLNYLVANDFSALVQILYRADVPEQKLKAVLKENPQADAGDLLAELLIQRQKEKMASRKATPPSDNLSGEETW